MQSNESAEVQVVVDGRATEESVMEQKLWRPFSFYRSGVFLFVRREGGRR